MRLDNISINTSRKRERIVIWTFSKKKKNRKKYLLRMSNFAVQSVWLNRAFKFAIKKNLAEISDHVRGFRGRTRRCDKSESRFILPTHWCF